MKALGAWLRWEAKRPARLHVFRPQHVWSRPEVSVVECPPREFLLSLPEPRPPQGEGLIKGSMLWGVAK